MPRLDGRVAIVTGAAQGIGAAYARALAAEGARVVIADVQDGAAAAAEIARAGGEAMALTADVTDAQSCAAMVEATVERFGGIDVLVNNAALFGQLERRPFENIDNDEWDRVIAVNVTGAFLCVRAAAPEMREKGHGKIINITSGTAFKGSPSMLHYVSSKGAIIAFTRALARELGNDGICVNAISPGLILSENILARADELAETIVLQRAGRSFKRDGMPGDLLGALVYLASADSDFVTGQTLVVDGGEVMH